MSRKRQPIVDEKPKVPAYIVTFSDMVTLLLTFFVLLLTLAEVQDPELFNKGRDSFIKSLQNFGLGMLPGRAKPPQFGEAMVKYYISKADDGLMVRTIDAHEEEVRRLFENLSKSVTSMQSQIVGETAKFSVASVRFSDSGAVLDESARKYLISFCADLGSSSRHGRIKLYVLGLADEQGSVKEQWLLSAQRAHVTAEFLNNTLPLNLRWPVYSWGAGPGGDWVGVDSAASEKSHILIGVLRTGG